MYILSTLNKSLKIIFAIIILYVTFCITCYAESDSVIVSNAFQLQNAITSANSTGGNLTVFLEDGTYTLSNTLWINASNIVVAGRSGNRDNVIIQGDAMSPDANVESIFIVSVSNFEVRDLTMQKCRNHIIQVKGENDADNLSVVNCVLRDSYEQMLKGSYDSGLPYSSTDNGLVENCLFEYSAGIGPQYYIGGIDVHRGRNWIVRGNIFRNIISPSQTVAEFAIHFWNNSSNNLVEKNLIINCDRGIGFGLDGRGNTGGTIRNNMIYHADNKGAYADVGIALTESPMTQVYNNTVFFENAYPWAIEYRFTSTIDVKIINNLTNRPIKNRDGASGTVSSNIIDAVSDWFVNSSTGDLHLISSSFPPSEAGQPIASLLQDFDGEPRPQGGGIDIGADEFFINPPPMPPENLRVVMP